MSERLQEGVNKREIRGVSSKDKLLDKARYMQIVLGQRVDQSLHKVLIVDSDRTINTLVNAISTNNSAQLRAFGLPTDAWFADIIEGIAEGRQIQINAVSSALGINSDKGFFPERRPGLDRSVFISSLLNTQRAYAATLKSIAPPDASVRVAVMAYDYSDSNMPVRFTPAQQQIFVFDVGSFTQGQIMESDDNLGQDVVVTRASEQLQNVEILIDSLRQSPHGVIREDEDGVWFVPDLKVVNAVDNISDDRRKELASKGILLKDKDLEPKLDALFTNFDRGVKDPTFKAKARRLREEFAEEVAELTEQGEFIKHDSPPPTRVAFETASLLDNDKINVFITNRENKNHYEEVYLLMRVLGLTGRDRSQPVFINNFNDLQEVGFSMLLQREVETFIYNLQRYEDFPTLTVDEARAYLHKNYGEKVDKIGENGILPEDETIIKILLEKLPELFPNGIDSLAIPGFGPFSYLALLLAPYLTDDARFDVTDRAVGMLEVAKKWQEGKKPKWTDKKGKKDAKVSTKFERYLVKEGGIRYEGSNDLARKKATLGLGDLYTLSENTYQVIAESFVSCSVSWSKSRYWEAIRAKARALKSDPETDSYMIGLHMVGSKSWGTKDRYPSVNLSLEDIRQAHLDAGLEIVEIIPINTDLKARDGYEGMAIVIAKKKKSSRS